MKKLSVLLSILLVLSLFAGCALFNQATQTVTESPDPAPTESPSPAPTEAPEANDNQETTPTTAPTEVSEENGFRFTRDNFPRLDGSTSLVPLAEAVACVLLGESREDVSDLVQFNRTTQSFRNLMYGNADCLIVGEPNAAVFQEMAEAGFEYELEVIGNDALVFMVNADNPVDNLTTEQIRDIYSGKITNWKEVGGNDAEIVPFQRNEGAGSQALLKKLVMKDLELMQPPQDYIVDSMGGLMESIRSYDNSANAIGYSVYYYAHDMEMAQGLKLIKVDGVAPSRESIWSGEYPHRSDNCCVIPADAPQDSPNRILFDWLMSDEGQKLVAAEGYVPVKIVD